MEKSNKLIAEFMGLIKYSEQHDGMYCVETMELDDFPILFKDGSYDSSWDWLIPVIDKCYQEHMSKHIADAVMTCNIDKAYQVVVEFIKDYNNGKQ